MKKKQKKNVIVKNENAMIGYTRRAVEDFQLNKRVSIENNNQYFPNDRLCAVHVRYS